MFFSGMINVHASLLPRWRGASPIIYAILNEDQTTGVTIMKIHPHKFDVGDIIAQKVIPIPKNVLMPELHQTLANEGAQLLLDCIHRVPDSLKSSRMQSDSNVTYGNLHIHSYIYQMFNIFKQNILLNFSTANKRFDGRN